jgi:hypothetical protein
MLDPQAFRREVQVVVEPTPFDWIRYALLLSPFAVKLLAGFEWAVLLALLVMTHQLRAIVRCVLVDTMAINLMKQYEHGVWKGGELRVTISSQMRALH